MTTTATRSASGTGRKDPLDDLGDLTFDSPDGFAEPAAGDMHEYTHVSLDDIRKDEAAARHSAADFDLLGGATSPLQAPASPLPAEASKTVRTPSVTKLTLEDPLQQQQHQGHGGDPFEEQSLSDQEEPLGAASRSRVVAVGTSAQEVATSRAYHNQHLDLAGTHGTHSSGGGGGGDNGLPEIIPEAADLEGLPLPESAVRLWVREPEKVEVTSKLGIKTSYVAYLVRTDSSLPRLHANGVEVRRRFSEFEALHKLLKTHYKGYFIPPLPEKSFIEAKIANDDFLRLRRADLQAFLRGVVHHPVLRETDAIHIFLLQPGELAQNPEWHNALHPPSSVLASGSFSGTSGGEGGHLMASEQHDSPVSSAGNAVKAVFSFAPAWATWIKHSVGVGQSPARELSEEEQMLRKNKELVGDLERLLELSCASARSLCSHMESVCLDFHELSKNMGMLMRFEEAVQAKNGQYTEAGAAAAGRAEDMQRMAYATAKQHKLWKTLSLKTAASLVALHDYMIMMPEAIAALEEREAALATVWSLEEELVSKQQALLVASGAKVQNREKKTYALNQVIATVEDQIRVAREQYRTIKDRNLSELTRLGLERGSDFHRMMGQFAATQASLMQASAAMWSALAVQYGARAAAQTP